MARNENGVEGTIRKSFCNLVVAIDAFQPILVKGDVSFAKLEIVFVDRR